MMDFYNRNTPTARKPHKCEMCGGEIKPGERYFYEVGKYCGDFFTRHMHLDCEAVLDEYCTEVDSEFDWDSVADYWRDNHCYKCEHYYPDCQPDKDCSPDTCNDKRNGKCTCGDPCDKDFDRFCWCTKFKEVKRNG